MRFEPLYYPDRIHVANPEGDVGVVVLWTPLDKAKELLERLVPGILDAEQSRVAVVANLYGDGMLAMLCNLLHNPQVRHLIAVGEDQKLPTCDEIRAFIERGLETASVLGMTVFRIKGTSRQFPQLDGFDAERLRSTLTFRNFGNFSTPGLDHALSRYVGHLPNTSPESTERISVELQTDIDADYRFRPSNSSAHQVVRPRPLDCWQELVTRVMRFGRPVELSDGARLELINAHTVITDPVEEDAQALAGFGFDLADLHAYQTTMFDAHVPENFSYTYGNRLGGFFNLVAEEAEHEQTQNTLDAIIAYLRHDPNTRHGYVSLWDNTTDLRADGLPGTSTPCLTTLFFRVSGDRLHLTTTYRAHNLLIAWLRNAYGLIAIQRYVAERARLPIGPITIISESLTIDPSNTRYELAKKVAATWSTDNDLDPDTGRRSLLRQDPNGYFRVSVDGNEVVAEHCFGGLVLKTYRGRTAARIEHQVIADMAVSLPSHAIWLGRELMINENLLRSNKDGT